MPDITPEPRDNPPQTLTNSVTVPEPQQSVVQLPNPNIQQIQELLPSVVTDQAIERNRLTIVARSLADAMQQQFQRSIIQSADGIPMQQPPVSISRPRTITQHQPMFIRRTPQFIGGSLTPHEQLLNNVASREWNFEAFSNYLLSLGKSRQTIKQYVVQARRFYNLYYMEWISRNSLGYNNDGSKQQLFESMNQFAQLTKNRIVGGNERYDTGNKKFVVYALKHWFTFINKEQLFREYYEKYGKSIKSKPRKVTNKSISIEDIKKVYEKLMYPFRTVFAIQYETGSRVSEVINLRIADVQISSDESMVLSAIGKGGTIRRLNVTNKTTIESIKHRLEEARLIGIDSTEKLFKQIDGVPLTVDACVYMYKRCSQEAIGKKISTHYLRHSRGVHVYQKSHDLLEVKELLGHKKIEDTYNYIRSAGIDTKETIKKNPAPW